MLHSPNIQPALIRVNERILMNDKNQQKWLLHLYQAIAHRDKLNMTPTGYRNSNDLPVNPHLLIEN